MIAARQERFAMIAGWTRSLATGSRRARRRLQPVALRLPEHYAVFMESYYGPLVKARERLTAEGRWEDCRAEILALAERRNEATDGSPFMNAEYLIVAGRKAV
jgi:hypothetical protein